MKPLMTILRDGHAHWVGDGFPVRTVFAPQAHAQVTSPFLLLDYAGPAEFPPADEPRGVDVHPHRGFETVTLVYSGEVDHQDSSGGGGRIGPGDVQWMTAASGLVHEEKHSLDFTRRGGVLEMVQLWVNLPAQDKRRPPRYQALTSSAIPIVALPDDAGRVRVIAGDFAGTHGAAQTYTPINVWDVQMSSGGRADFSVPPGHTALVFVLSGRIRFPDGQVAEEADLAILDRQGSTLVFDADQDSRLLFLGGAPLEEPVVAYGPFVMNTAAEIQQAIEDFRSGRMGRLPGQ